MRVVIKVGTSSLVSDHGTIALGTLASLVETVCRLRELGHAVVLVSSGAVGCGCIRMGLSARPSATSKRQALAAVGQMRLMRHYDDMFAAMGVCCAQVLLTYDNLNDRAQFVNARSTLDELLQYGAVPIVNENDTVAVEELRFGDNDTLSAKVAAMLGARHLFLLTDVDAVYTRNPAQNPDARRIAHVARSEAPALLAAQEEQESEQEPVAGSTTEASGGGSGGGGGSGWGTGGMEAKIRAAVLAAAAGAECVICSARDPAAILRLLHGSDEGTRFAPAPRHQRGRKRWIIGLPCRGTLVVDAGAARAVVSRKSLFAAGIVRVEGRFSAQDGVRLASQDGHELARGVCNYSSAEVARLLGRRSADMATVLGWQGPEEVVHRSAIAVTHAAGDPGAWGGGGAARAAPGGEEERDGVDGRAFTPAPADPSPAPAASAVEGLRWDARVDADSAAGTGTGQGEAARGADHAAGAATGSGAAAPGPRGDGGRDPPAEDPIRMDPIAADAGAGSAALREGEAGPAEEAGGSR